MSEVDIVINPTSHNDPRAVDDLLSLVALAQDVYGPDAKVLVATELGVEISEHLRSAVRDGNNERINKLLVANTSLKFLAQTKKMYHAFAANSIDVVAVGGTKISRNLFPSVAYQMLRDTAAAFGLTPPTINLKFEDPVFFHKPPIVYFTPEDKAIRAYGPVSKDVVHDMPTLMNDLFLFGIRRTKLERQLFSIINQYMRREFEYLTSERGFLGHARDFVMAQNVAGVILTENPDVIIVNVGASHAIPLHDMLEMMPQAHVKLLNMRLAAFGYRNLIASNSMHGSNEDICMGILYGDPQKFVAPLRTYLEIYAERLADRFQWVPSSEPNSQLVQATLDAFFNSTEGQTLVNNAVNTVSSHLQASNQEITNYLREELARAVRGTEPNGIARVQRTRITH